MGTLHHPPPNPRPRWAGELSEGVIHVSSPLLGRLAGRLPGGWGSFTRRRRLGLPGPWGRALGITLPRPTCPGSVSAGSVRPGSPPEYGAEHPKEQQEQPAQCEKSKQRQ